MKNPMFARSLRFSTPVWAGSLCVLMASCAQAAPPSADALAAIRQAAPSKPAARPMKARRVLVYTRANGFRHSSIETGAEAMKILGEKTGAWAAIISDDPASFENLSGYDAVLFLNTTGDALLPAGFDKLTDAEKTAAKDKETRYKANLMSFVNGGKGFVGIHAATDTMYSWPEFGQMIGGYFSGHPWNSGDEVTVRVEDHGHPVTSHLNGQSLTFKEEIYQFKEPYSRQKQRVVMGLDMAVTQPKGGMNRADNDYPVTWVKPQGAGRVFYSSLGHNEAMYSNSQVLGVYLAGIQYALGDLRAESTPIAQMPPQYADAVMGEYVATLGRGRNAPQLLTRVIAEGKDAYRAVVYWPGAQNTTPANADPVANAMRGRRVELTGTRVGNTINFTGKDGDADIKATWAAPLPAVGGGRPATASLRLTQMSPAMTLPNLRAGQPLEFVRTERTSPTLGAPAPRGAIALLPFATTPKAREAGPSLSEWRNENWIPMRDGSVQINKGDNHTKREFGDMKLHVEWMSPLMPEARGQARGNSGIYLQERYELQVLDSFGLEPQDNDAGGIYRVSKPAVNAALPPGTWQTYDITFRAPRLYADGTVARLGSAQVFLNGVLIHENAVLRDPTGGGANGIVARGPIKLQDHGDRVRYRNIWVQELNDQPWTPVANPDPNAGFRTLFDQSGKLDAFAWAEGKPGPKIEDGAIAMQGAGDIWTKEQYENFVMDLEYTVEPNGNSGVFIRNPKPGDWYAGMEIQVFDSHGKPQMGVHDAGGNYDVAAPLVNASKPTGEWNTMRIEARGQNIVVHINGQKTLDQDLNRWTQAGKNPDGTGNKFKTAYKDMPRKGHLELQDHGQKVWFRNIRVKPLP
jgi:type 1 glutamine amidotransferase